MLFSADDKSPSKVVGVHSHGSMFCNPITDKIFIFLSITLFGTRKLYT